MAHADHPYIKEPTLENYLASEHVIMAEPHYGALTQTDRYLMEKHKTKRRIAMHFADVYQILSVITHAKQPYLATLPEGILKDYPNKALRACPPPFENKSQDIVMLWDPYHRKDKAHRWLRQAIQHWAGTQDHSPQD